jgi:uncharacterized protein (TIGR02391 family)
VGPLTLADLIPDHDTLITLPTERVARCVLRVCSAKQQNGVFNLGSVAGRQALFEAQYPFGGAIYPRMNELQIELAAAEAFQWLENHGLIIPAASPNNSFHRLSRLGLQLISSERDFDSFVEAASFPRALIHPKIREDVWLQISLRNWAVAVFVAFRAVEVAVREAGSFEASEHGVSLMRKAFHKDSGPLRDEALPDAEREALANLFAGAIGSYKNPHSHRQVEELEAAEAQEMIMLASHLLRIVDDRSSRG